ncbi:PPR repeat [Musa troglodytarum]|uniref:PPR repeat n=1 Tax=Musa troglodytarum TaxID=320322 RepID=A0A9E7KAZ0_9LILI|nr:PPR repeat [Musa troglodytarum]
MRSSRRLRAALRVAAKTHAWLLKSGDAVDPCAWNKVLASYSESDGLAEARKLFDEIPLRDTASWNSLIAAHVLSRAHRQAWSVFGTMLSEGLPVDQYTFGSVLKSVACAARLDLGRQVHALIVKSSFDRDVFSGSALVDMYAKCGRIREAVVALELMPEPNVVSWNAVVAGYARAGDAKAAFHVSRRMEREGVMLDEATFASLLTSCSDLAVLQLGRQIHGLALRSGFAANEFVGSSLIYMYSKCGVLGDARQAFDETPHGSSVTWNSMIFGYAQHGRGRTALDLFSEMREREVSPDHITFVGLITACSHAGLVEEGSRLLKLMRPAFGVPPRMEHYACGVDLFGRAGRLDEAKRLVESMPFEPDAMVWMTLLGACRIHGDMALARHVTERLRLSEAEHHSTYVLLSHMYSGLGLWADRAAVQRTMRSRGLSKVPGWSWIEITNEVHCFNAEDRSHPRSEEIYRMLELLMETASLSEIEVLDSIP